jgi:hypothetical protein
MHESLSLSHSTAKINKQKKQEDDTYFWIAVLLFYMKQGLTMSVMRPCCLSFLSAGITGAHHHSW